MSDLISEHFPIAGRLEKVKQLDYRRQYSADTYLFFFFAFAIMGWGWEVIVFFFQEGMFINRGILFGPWLPIYGVGGVAILLLLRRFAESKLLTFFMVMMLCTALEYMTGWFLESATGVRWWDYTGYMFNINGRICLLGAFVFGLGGIALIYVLAPLLDDFYRKIPPRAKYIMGIIFLLLFLADVTYSHFHPNTGYGITEYHVRAQLNMIFVLI